MVHQAVALGAELELPSLSEIEGFEERSVPLRLAGRANLPQIARECSDIILPLICGSAIKRRSVEPLRNAPGRGRQCNLVVGCAVKEDIAKAQRWTALYC